MDRREERDRARQDASDVFTGCPIALQDFGGRQVFHAGDEDAGLFRQHPSRDRGTKILNYLADVTVNQPHGTRTSSENSRPSGRRGHNEPTSIGGRVRG